MTRYEYKVRPAPTKGRKDKGLKTPEARFAHALETEINDMAAQGWDYHRTDILPSEERQGLTSSQTVYRTVMVFRRAVSQAPAGDAVTDDTPLQQATAQIGPGDAPQSAAPETDTAATEGTLPRPAP